MNIIIPGLHNSDEHHWQTYFETTKPSDFLRINQHDWDAPDCTTWIDKIEKDLDKFTHSDLILIGHSIGCMAILKWFEKYGHVIKGALLVAPSDAEKENYPTYITGFAPIPMAKIPFPTIVVGSTNDHVTSFERTIEFADSWGSELVTLENAGHIESKSGFGEWNNGLKLVDRLGKVINV